VKVVMKAGWDKPTRMSRTHKQAQAVRQKLSLTERMRRIRKTDTKPEMIVRRLLHAMGYRYRLHDKRLPGNPDIVLPRHRKVILVHGCFWHRHDCPDGRKLPRSKPDYWGPKLERNRQRDEQGVAQLRELGWDVLVVWECELKPAAALVDKLKSFLATNLSPVGT
jgi:DNA mismatch endonuclease, patch repair protein